MNHPATGHTHALRCRAFCVAAALMVLLTPLKAPASEKTFDEYQVKAVFLYRLALFITWPQGTFSSPDQPFRIGIVGDDPFGSHIDRVVEHEKVGSHPIQILRFDSIDAVSQTPCQMLYIHPDLTPEWPQLKQMLASRRTLTVSDMERFGQMGGMITIRTQVRRIKMEINPKEIQRAGLNVSSKLLKVSRHVATDPDGGSL